VVISGTVIRENLVRVVNIPLVFKAHSMPEQLPHTKVTLGVGEIDLIDLNLHTRFIAAEAPAATTTTEEVAC
jgi:exoribonuclease-2